MAAEAVEEQQRAALLDSGVGPQNAQRSWERLSDPQLWPQERLFFELYAYALRGRPGTEGFLDGIVESWVAPVTAALVEAGADERTARADARLAVAVVRGLLLDLLATGDRAGVTEAYERFLQHVSATGAPPPTGASTGARPVRPATPARGQPSRRAAAATGQPGLLRPGASTTPP